MRLGSSAIERKSSWKAHSDTVKTIQLVQDTLSEEEMIKHKEIEQLKAHHLRNQVLVKSVSTFFDICPQTDTLNRARRLIRSIVQYQSVGNKP